MKALSELGISKFPWTVESDCYCPVWIRDYIGECVTEVDGFSHKGIYEDGCIMAAAPEMAKVCYDLIMWDGCRDASICDIVAAAKAAYAKACGEEAR